MHFTGNVWLGATLCDVVDKIQSMSGGGRRVVCVGIKIALR